MVGNIDVVYAAGVDVIKLFDFSKAASARFENAPHNRLGCDKRFERGQSHRVKGEEGFGMALQEQASPDVIIATARATCTERP